MRRAFSLVLLPLLFSTASCAVTCNPSCPEILAPVCGSDGVTYDNKCLLEYTKCAKNPSLQLVQQGKCNASSTGTGSGCNAGDSCLDVYEPVCGTDGQTYGNDCQLQLQVCSNKTLKVAYKGQCKANSNGSASGCNDACIDLYDPVCGSDNKTYGNDCELNRAKCKNPSLTLKSKGKCTDNNATVRPPPLENSTVCDKGCDRTFVPVCGSDGTTYNNACLLEVAQCKDQTLTKKADGACSSSASSGSKTTSASTKEPQKDASKSGSKKNGATSPCVSLQFVSVYVVVVALAAFLL